MKKAARIAIIIVLLALIRCLAEFFRLEYQLGDKLTVLMLKPFMLGALISSISCLIMAIGLFYSKNRLVVVIAVLTITVLLVIKAAGM